MSDSLKDSTEAKIKEAANELFATHGLKGTTMRMVAEKAEVNVALVNYYFRSKDKLFISIFEERLDEYSVKAFEILTDDSKRLFERVEEFINAFNTRLIKDSALPVFLVSETFLNPDILNTIAKQNAKTHAQRCISIQKVLDKEFELGNIRKVLACDFETILASLVIFPILSKTLMVKTGKIKAFGFHDFDAFNLHWKNTTMDTIKAYLRPD